MSRRLQVAAACGVLAPIAFVATTLVAGALREGYDPTTQAISELFEVGAPTGSIVVAGFVAFGLLGLPFAWALFHGLPGDPSLAALAVVLDALATLAILAFPCTAGCPGPASTGGDLWHSVFAGLAYLGHLGAPLLVARHLRRYSGWAGLRAASWALGLLAAGLFAFWLVGLAGAYGGLAQRAFTIASDLWFVTAGGWLLVRARRTSRATPSVG